ncbi:hypothetical protein VE00_05096 [Pseudogymnoascus sp. WSF 3629]|nr:hypothetical protein VE00_05096 [Pseudogymnoascus sp. WSF 3629]
MDIIYSSAAEVFVFLGAGFDLTADDYLQKVILLQRLRFRTYAGASLMIPHPTRNAYSGTRERTKLNKVALSHLFAIRMGFDDSGLGIETSGGLEYKILHEYLQMYHRRDATDPRDTVYSLLSLTKLEDAPLLIYPDYKKTVEEVYITTARTIIEGSGSLDISSVAGRLHSAKLHWPDGRNHPDVPSWVPDWSVTYAYDESAVQVKALLAYDACFGTKAEVSFEAGDSSVLSVKGTFLDGIEALGQAATPGKGDKWQTVFEWMQLAQTHAPTKRWVDFCRTLMTDLIIWPYDRIYRRAGPLTKEMIRGLPYSDPNTGQIVTDCPPEELIQPSADQVRYCFTAWWGLLNQVALRNMVSSAPGPGMQEQLEILTARRRFVVLSSGLIGLVPFDAEEETRWYFLKAVGFLAWPGWLLGLKPSRIAIG